MKTDLTTFADLSIEARTKVIRECLEQTLSAFEKSEDRLKRTCEVLRQQKAAVGHGKWTQWLADNFGGDDATIQRIRRYLRKDAANSNSSLLNYLGESTGSEPDPPKAERKTDRVKVIEPGQQDATEPDLDPAPAKPTHRKTTAATTKPKEADKPKTQPLVPEILADAPKQSDPVADWLESHTLAEIVERLVGKIEDDKSKKTAAKQLRKLADKLDPPTKFVKPELDDVSVYFAELKAADPDSFFDFYESKGWLVGKVSMNDWRASARKWVRENATNGRSNGNGSGHGRAATANPGGNSRPPVERAKITYK